MSTNALGKSESIPILLSQLADHLRFSGSDLFPEEAAARAIRAWIDADNAARPEPEHDGEPATGRGYRWKNLFLPAGTELRMECCGDVFYGRVAGDRILYQGHSVSPRGMTLAVAGEGRNAWRDLWLRLPDARCWKQAIILRREQERSPVKPQQSPAEVIETVAATMSDTLKTALALVDHITAQAARKVERRLDKHRREADIFAGDCAFDEPG